MCVIPRLTLLEPPTFLLSDQNQVKVFRDFLSFYPQAKEEVEEIAPDLSVSKGKRDETNTWFDKVPIRKSRTSYLRSSCFLIFLLQKHEPSYLPTSHSGYHMCVQKIDSNRGKQEVRKKEREKKSISCQFLFLTLSHSFFNLFSKRCATPQVGSVHYVVLFGVNEKDDEGKSQSIPCYRPSFFSHITPHTNGLKGKSPCELVCRIKV